MSATLLIDLVGFAAFASNVAGNLLLAWKRIDGWIVRAVSIVLWGIYASNIDSWPMIANSVTFFAINCFGFWKWRKKQAEERWLDEQRRHA